MFYGFSRVAMPFALRLAGSLRIEHTDRIPLDGGVMIVANHAALVDPILVCAAAPRRLRPIAKRELFETPLVGWTVWLYGAFPVRRHSGDLGALRAGRNHLRAGRAVLVHPEGTRSPDGRLTPGLPGSAVMALLGGAPIVPCAITGTHPIRGPRSILNAFLRRNLSIRVVFGEPFTLNEGRPTADRAEEATDFIMRRIAELMPEEYRGAYGAGSEGQLVVARHRDDDSTE
jgi:1-acyl-sn-glycerol-3-phosphate acyltransferase